MRDPLSGDGPPFDAQTVIALADGDGLSALCGPLDRNLRALEDRLGVTVAARGADLHLSGAADAVRAAAEVIHALYARARVGRSIDADAVGREIAMVLGEGVALRDAVRRRPHLVGRVDAAEWLDGGRAVAARTPGQLRYVEAIRSHDLTFGVGPAGTGKTWLAVACALAALQRHEVKRIVLTRPAVEAGEQLGFLPGDLRDKVSPYLRPLYDAIGELLDGDQLERLVERGQVEAAPLAFMRGRTLSHAFVILDEAQNCTPEQMLMLLTRMGDHTRIVVTGDPSQSDLRAGQRHGLDHAVDILAGVPGVAVVRLDATDIVRHPLVARILAAYAEAPARGAR